MAVPWGSATPTGVLFRWWDGASTPLPDPTGPLFRWWDGTTLHTATLLGWWDGSALQPVEALGWWDGDSIEPFVASGPPPVVYIDNLLSNPSFENNFSDWTLGSGVTYSRVGNGGEANSAGTSVAVLTLAAEKPAGADLFWTEKAIEPNSPVSFMVHGRRASGSFGNVRAALAFYDADDVLLDTQLGASTAVIAGSPPSYKLLTAFGTAPATAVKARSSVRLIATTAAGQSCRFDAAMLATVAGALGSADYFDGDTPDTAEYIYSWTGTPHGSPSRRTNV